MRLAAATLALLLSLPALAKEVAGVQVPDTVTVGGAPLQLNGAGLRKKLFIKVYVGALYLRAPSQDAAAIVAADAPWQVTMTFLRDVEKEKILGAFKDGFENNSKAELAQLLPGLKTFDAALKDLKEKDVLVIRYEPGTGSTVVAPGGATATVPGQPFGAALLRNWLGAEPADGDLKQGMLGR